MNIPISSVKKQTTDLFPALFEFFKYNYILFKIFPELLTRGNGLNDWFTKYNPLTNRCIDPALYINRMKMWLW